MSPDYLEEWQPQSKYSIKMKPIIIIRDNNNKMKGEIK